MFETKLKTYKPIPHIFTCPKCKDEFSMFVTMNDLEELQKTYGESFEKLFHTFLCDSCERGFRE